MDFQRLRNLIHNQLPSLKDSVTHPEIPTLCERLGLPPPPPESPQVGKRQRLQTSLDAAEDSHLPKIAERLLARRPLDTPTRHIIEDMLWSDDRFEVPRRMRRDLARGLEMSHLYKDVSRFEALLDRFWHLDDDDLDFFFMEGQRNRSLRKRLAKHVFQNPDWSVEELFDQLGALNCISGRFVRFIEALAASDNQLDEAAQRSFVSLANPHLRAANVELRETGIDEGYPLFTAANLTDSTFSAPKQLIFASAEKPDLRWGVRCGKLSANAASAR